MPATSAGVRLPVGASAGWPFVTLYWAILRQNAMYSTWQVVLLPVHGVSGVLTWMGSLLEQLQSHGAKNRSIFIQEAAKKL